MKRILFYPPVCLLIITPGILSTCPKSELLNSPCLCETDRLGKITLSCTSVQSVDVLITTLRSFRDLTIDRFFLSSSSIGYLPSNLFFKICVRDVAIQDTPISHFTEASESAFLGQEKCLEELALRRSGLTSEAEVTALSNLGKLLSLDLSFNKIDVVIDSWFNVPPVNLRFLYLKNSGIREIKSNAFSKILKLTLLDLSENKITLLERSMLPQPATHLEYLYLSYNKIDHFPVDCFSSMSSLKRLYVDHNQLTSLPETVWRPLWQTHVQRLDLLGNYIRCQCDELLWMTEYEVEFLTGVCADPDKLRGRKLASLWPWEICGDSKMHNMLQGKKYANDHVRYGIM